MPVALVQYSRVPRREAELFGYDPSARVYKFNLFLGEPASWGKGVGTRVIVTLRDYLRRVRGASRVMAQPRINNPRAIRALEKAGFRQVRILTGYQIHEGVATDCVLMDSL